MFVREGHNAHLHQRFGDDGDDNASSKKGKKKKKEKKRKKDLETRESDVEVMKHVSSDSFAPEGSKRTKRRKKKKHLEESQVTETQDRTTHKKAKKRSTSMESQVLPLPANKLSSKSRTNTKTITKKAKKNKKTAISSEKKKKEGKVIPEIA